MWFERHLDLANYELRRARDLQIGAWVILPGASSPESSTSVCGMRFNQETKQVTEVLLNDKDRTIVPANAAIWTLQTLYDQREADSFNFLSELKNL
jgi:hypothetical protein